MATFQLTETLTSIPWYLQMIRYSWPNLKMICNTQEHNLNRIASEFSMEINAEKTRVMAFRGMEPIRSKICINNNNTLKQQNTFNYLG
jgi:hypothetical protein